ncbi:MAG: tripartite tricarboxylate transporter substrate binding protein [Burkholderiales bacterium]|nr:tripartite tricarboxylate transporter substrate binding protein [Burkholderiales bacterium]
MLIAAGAASCAASFSFAQDWPTRPIRVVIPSAAGGLGDVVTRTIAPAVESRLGQRLLVEAKPGAGGDIGATEVARAASDGYTVMLAPTAVYGVLPHVQKNVRYDPIKDFAPVTMVVDAPILLLVNSGLPVRNLKELAAYTRANPGKLNVGSAGYGTPAHILGEYFGKLHGSIVSVTYVGAPQVSLALQTNQVQVLFATLAGVRAQLAAGSVRLVAVLARQRIVEHPEVQTALEAGFPEIGEFSSGWGMVAPRATDRRIVERLSADIRAALADPLVKRRFAEAGQIAVGSTPEEFARFIRAEYERWKKVIDQAGIKPE